MDTAVPATPGALPNLITQSDWGTSNTDNITSLTTGMGFNASGAEAGSTVNLYEDANNDGILVASELVSTAVADGTGLASFNGVALAAGLHHMKTEVVDAAGNVSAASPDLLVDNSVAATHVTAGGTTPTATYAAIGEAGVSSPIMMNQLGVTSDYGSLGTGIRITAVGDTAVGHLQLDGVDVVLNQVISASDIAGGHLRVLPNATGSSVYHFNYDAMDNAGNTASSDMWVGFGGLSSPVNGTTGADNLNGNTGTHRQTPINGLGGADTIFGGGGSKVIEISVPDQAFASIVGGDDTTVSLLKFTGAGTFADLANKVQHIDAIELGTGSNQTLKIAPTEVTTMAANGRSLYINGDAGDTLVMAGGVGTGASQWHLTNSSNGVDTYTFFDISNNAAQIQLLVDNAILIA